MKMIEQNDSKQTLEATNNSGSKTAGRTVFVYGYGQSKIPFYKQTKALKTNSNGCSLILSAAVSCGQKLLLINTQQNPAEAEIVNTRSLSGQLLEVEVSFPAPRPDFWLPLQ
jgi:hypothetical protein